MLKDQKNILISCIYRTTISELYEIHKEKMIFVCGDFNIDLMKSNEHAKTKEFVDIMFSLSFYPLIGKPSRIIKDSATLIDNIFTNVMGEKIIRGLLVTGVSDHLPVFTVLDTKSKFNLRGNRHIYKLVREKSPEAILTLKASLSSHDKFMQGIPMKHTMHF